jgi:dsRNA-specific ribonuclease
MNTEDKVTQILIDCYEAGFFAAFYTDKNDIKNRNQFISIFLNKVIKVISDTDLVSTNKETQMTYKTKQMLPATTFKPAQDTPTTHSTTYLVHRHREDRTTYICTLRSISDYTEYMVSLTPNPQRKIEDEPYQDGKIVVHIWEKGVNK